MQKEDTLRSLRLSCGAAAVSAELDDAAIDSPRRLDELDLQGKLL